MTVSNTCSYSNPYSYTITIIDPYVAKPSDVMEAQGGVTKALFDNFSVTGNFDLAKV